MVGSVITLAPQLGEIGLEVPPMLISARKGLASVSCILSSQLLTQACHREPEWVPLEQLQVQGVVTRSQLQLQCHRLHQCLQAWVCGDPTSSVPHPPRVRKQVRSTTGPQPKDRRTRAAPRPPGPVIELTQPNLAIDYSLDPLLPVGPRRTWSRLALECRLAATREYPPLAPPAGEGDETPAGEGRPCLDPRCDSTC
jgi:hypothetical protein